MKLPKTNGALFHSFEKSFDPSGWREAFQKCCARQTGLVVIETYGVTISCPRVALCTLREWEVVVTHDPLNQSEESHRRYVVAVFGDRSDLIDDFHEIVAKPCRA